jgi:type IV pilus assembly protein PilC
MEEGKKQSTVGRIGAWLSDRLSTVSFVEKFMLIHHLEIMTKAGLSIVESLRALSTETENKKLRRIITEIKSDIETGKQLSEVLAKYPQIFPRIYVSMIAAGEIAGKLEDALSQISSQMKKTQRLTSKVRGAMLYPLIIICAMAGISCFVVFYILPKILVMFEDVQVELPLATRVLIGITKFSQNYWWLMLAVIIFAVIAFLRLMKIYEFKKKVHQLMLRLPIFGPIIKKVNLARFTLTLSSLLGSTIPIVEATHISADVLNNVIYKENLMTAADGLRQGETLSEILSIYPKNFPAMVTEMIMVGEQTGRVEKMLGELSEYYNNEVEETMNNFTAIIEPVIILILGLGVAGIAVAVIMPMYSLAQSI